MLQIIGKHAEGAFEPEDVAILVAAFEAAWKRLETSGARYGSERARQRAREQLGRSIIEVARGGERDPRRLCEDGLLIMTKTNLRAAPTKK